MINQSAEENQLLSPTIVKNTYSSGNSQNNPNIILGEQVLKSSKVSDVKVKADKNEEEEPEDDCGDIVENR
jgi:hypothetical protein